MASKKTDVIPEMETDDATIDFGDLDVFVDDMLDAVEVDSGLEAIEAIGTLTEPDVTPKASVGIDLTDLEALITDIDDSVEYLTWLIYGKNGTGKTTILSTGEGVLILAAEDGTLSIKDKAKGKAMKLKIDTWSKLEGVYWLLRNGKYETDKEGRVTGITIKTKKGKFLVKYLGFDTITKLAEVCMRNVVLGEKEKDPDKDILKKTLRNWGDMNEKMKYWLQQFNELPLQKVWLLQETTNAEDLESDEYTIYPAVNKGLRTYLQSEADIIARTYIVKTVKGMQFRLTALPNPTFITKDRTNELVGAIPNPNLGLLHKLIFKDK